MPHVPGSDSNTYTFNLDQPSPFHTHSHTRLDGERALSHTSVLIIHPTKKLDPIGLWSSLSQMTWTRLIQSPSNLFWCQINLT